MIQKIYFSESTYNRIYEDGYLGNANIIFEKALDKEDIFNIRKQNNFYIVDEDLKQRIDKAIAYIEKGQESAMNSLINGTSNIEIISFKHILDILKGRDKE